MSETRYLTCAETAKLVRKALKREFPGVKFSVRSKTYSGGASINVGWTDGPTRKDVEATAGVYAGGDFDGMIDMAFHVTTWLMPDGSATWGKSPGTGGQHGSCPDYNYEKPHPDAELVSMGSDYVFCTRSYTVPMEHVGRDLCTLQQMEYTDLNMGGLLGPHDTEWLLQHIRTLLARTTFKPGEHYVGVGYTPNNPEPQAWCGIYKDFAPEDTEELEAASEILSRANTEA